MEIVNKEYKSTTKGSMADKFRRKAMQISAMQRKHELTIEAMMKDWMDGGHGYVPDKKPDGVVRIMMENWNSIKLFTEKSQERISKINETRKRYNADIMLGCEPQVDWSMADSEHQFYELFGFGEPKKGKAAYNYNEHIQRCQQGGTAAMAFGRLSSYVTETGTDATNLGRWTHLKISNAYKTVRVVMAYRPCMPSSIRRRGKSEKEEQYGSNMTDISGRVEKKETHWRCSTQTSCATFVSGKIMRRK